MMSDYFSFYEFEPSFLLDEALLRRKYLQYSRDFHPDFYGLESEEKQSEALELSSKNNEAFKVLSDFDSRFAYILSLHGLMDENNNKTALPQSFLFEMMEINEALSELEFLFSEIGFDKLEGDIDRLKSDLYAAVLPDLTGYNKENADVEMLNRLLVYYLKNRYLNRIQTRLKLVAERKS
jgi:molecular chaperone HscB